MHRSRWLALALAAIIGAVVMSAELTLVFRPSLDYNAIVAWTGVAAAFIAAVAILHESRRSRFALGVDLLLKFDERFDSDAMRAARRAAAKSILDHTFEDVRKVLDFFEMIGLMLRRGALDDSMVWEMFSAWVLPYCRAARSWIQDIREHDPDGYSNLLYLYDKMNSLEKLHRGRAAED